MKREVKKSNYFSRVKRLIIIFLFISITAFGQTNTEDADLTAAIIELLYHRTTHYEVNGADVDVEKAMILKDINYARANPTTYGRAIAVNLSKYSRMGRLDTLYKLNVNAQWYAEKLLERGPQRFDHSGMPNEVMLWNYDVCGSIDQFIIDKNVPDLAHRRMLLNPGYTQVGIGVAKGWVGDAYRTYVVMLME